MTEQQQQVLPKKYLRNYTDEGREKQKVHLDSIRQMAMDRKKQLKEITLKSKLMKLEPKLDLAKQYDEYINNKNQIVNNDIPVPESQEIVYIRPKKEKKKKIIYKEVEEEEEEEEEVVYIKKNKRPEREPPPESLDRTLYKSSTEQLHLRAVEERIKHNLAGWHGALMPCEY
jgi:hypothetical protein